MPPVDQSEVRIELPIDAYVPEEWVASERLRLEVYTKISASRTAADREAVRAELADRYGEIPQQVERLLRLAALREQVAAVGVEEVTAAGRFVRFAPVELPDSRQVRLRRLYPRAVTKAAIRAVLVPLPEEASGTGIKLGGATGRGGSPVTNDAALDFVEQFIRAILAAPAAA